MAPPYSNALGCRTGVVPTIQAAAAAFDRVPPANWDHPASMTEPTHRVVPHRSTLSGVEALTLLTDRAFPRHSHDHLGIGVMARGSQRSWSGVGPVEARAGDVITVNPGEMHDGLPIRGQARLWRMIHLDPAFIADAIRDALAGEAELARPAFADPVLATRFHHAFTELAAPVPDRMAIEENVLRCLVHAFRHHGARRPPPDGRSPAIALARQRLDDAPELPASLADLAALSGMSRFQLVRGFARETGATPHAYLIQRRVRLARRHLAAGLPLAEAALQAGFADQSHMTRAFVRQLGLTPGRYRAALA